jgi:hypothetical protein
MNKISINNGFIAKHADKLRHRLVQVLTKLRRVHADERGTLSIVTVFALLMFTMLLIMIVNVGTHVDDKLKMQNASDAATYSGGVVLARGMNGLAYTNHLLSDVFAMTAYLREARDRNAESLVPQVLNAWDQVGQRLSQAGFAKFQALGFAIREKVPMEAETVTAYGELNYGAARLSLPVFEHILSERLIGEFQRELIISLPTIAQAVTNEVARRHGLLGPSSDEGSSPRSIEYEAERGPQQGVLWRTNVMPVSLADESDPATRTMPVVDPDPFESDYMQLTDADVYYRLSFVQRRNLAKGYLRDWNFDRLRLFNHDAKMSAYFHLWRIATCGQLDQLLNIEYPLTNLPIMMRHTASGDSMEQLLGRSENPGIDNRLNRRRESDYPFVMYNLQTLTDLDDYIDNNLHFVGVVYRRHRKELGPGLFENPLEQASDAQTFSQIRLFLPRPRSIRIVPGRSSGSAGGTGSDILGLGGTFGFTSQLEIPRQRPPSVPSPGNELDERWVLEGWPTHFDLLNQNWMVQLVPATTPNLNYILSANPGGDLSNLRLPNYGRASTRNIKGINTH